MAVFKTIKSGINKFSGALRQIVPLREIAKGFGVLGAMDEAEKSQEKILQLKREIGGELAIKMKEARERGDRRQVERYKKIANDSLNSELESDTVLEATLKNAPNQRQVIASAAEGALWAALGFKPGLKSVKGLKAVQPTTKFGKFLGKAGLVTRSGSKIYRGLNRARFANATTGGKIAQKGIQIGKEALIGSGFFATLKAQEKDASTEDIIHAAELGAAVGAGTVGLFAGIGKGIEKVSPGISKTIKKGVRGLEKVSAEKTIPKGKSQVDKTLSTIGIGRKQIKKYTADMLLKGVQAVRQFKQKFIDRYSPIKRMEDIVSEYKGKPLAEWEKVYRDARLLRSVSNSDAETRIVGLADDLRAYDDVVKTNEADAYLLQLDYIDRAKNGLKVPGGKSLKTLKKDLRKMISELGPQKMERLGKVRGVVKDFHWNLLNDRYRAGLISKQEMNRILGAHPNYIPHDVIMNMEEKNLKFLSSSINVAKTDLMKAVGSTRKIKKPLEAIMTRTPIASKTIQKNKLLTNMIKAQEKWNVFPGMKKLGWKGARRLKDVKTGKIITQPILEKPKSGFGKINLFKDGIKETWQVPKDIAAAIKNTDATTTSGFWKLFTSPQKLLKKGATQYNLGFALPNKFRDLQTAAATSPSFMESLAKKYGTGAPKVFSLKQTRQLYKQVGGYGASIFREGDDWVFKQLSKKGIAKKMGSKNPFKVIEAVNEQIEQSTRLGVFKKALRQGLAPKDAALVSREASIDFARMGQWMQKANEAIPFLNARVQGFVNIPRAFVKNPETFARMQLWTSAYPTMLLHSHNRRFNSYKNIPQYYKNKYWTIMTGEEEAIDSYTGNKMLVPQFLSFPKGEGQALVSGPLQAYLDKMDGTDYRKTSEIIADTLGAASPLEFQTFDQSNFFGSAIAQLGPLASIPYGIASNKHPYFGSPIIPEGREETTPKELQFRESTPEVARELGDVMGVAPARVEFVLDSFGGLPQDAQSAADLVLGLINRDNLIDDLKEKSLSETDFGAASRFPIARRFLREANAFYGPLSEFRKQQEEEIKTELKGKTLRTKDKAKEIWEEMNEKEAREDKLNYLNSLGDELTPEIKERLLYLKNNRRSVEALDKSDSTDFRARYIQMRLEEMSDRENKIEFLKNLEREKILTNTVKRKIRALQLSD